MEKEDFEKLVSSIKEARKIKSGKKKPSRVYEVNPQAVKKKLNVP
jgi:putative transcriptional regulator